MALLDFILGPMVVGTALSVFFGGILVTQCYTYFLRFPNDPKWMKSMVLYFFLTDLFHSGLEIAIIYEYTVTFFGEFPKIEVATWFFAMIPVTSVCISSVAQAFFAWRVSRLTRSRLLGAVIYTLAIVQFLCGIGVTIGITVVKTFTRFIEFQGVVIPWLVSSVLCDLIITTALVWFLSKNKSGIAATDDIVTRLIRSTVQTGAITTIWALLDLVIYLTEDNSLHLLFNFPLAKVYTNSLLSTLNARRSQSENTASNSSGTWNKGMGVGTGNTSMPVWERKGSQSQGATTKTQSIVLKSNPRRNVSASLKGGVAIEIEITKSEYTHSQVTHDIPILPPRYHNKSGLKETGTGINTELEDIDSRSYEMDESPGTKYSREGESEGSLA